MKIKCTNMPKDSAWLEEMTTIALQSPLICLNPQDDPTLIPKPGSHLTTGTDQTHFPYPKASLSHRVMKHSQQEQQTDVTSLCSAFQQGP